MKLAEALQERADLQKRIDQLEAAFSPAPWCRRGKRPRRILWP